MKNGQGRSFIRIVHHMGHTFIVLPNEFSPDRSRQDRLQVRIRIRLARFGAVEPLGVEIFQAWQQLEAQEVTGPGVT